MGGSVLKRNNVSGAITLFPVHFRQIGMMVLIIEERGAEMHD